MSELYRTFAQKSMGFNFERLTAWQKSRELVKAVYKATAFFPNSEKYALVDQLRRAAVSISSNLAEGSGRISTKEKIHFCEIAYGSLMEVMCQLILACDLGLLEEEYLTHLREQIDELSRLISGYRRSLVNCNE